MIFVRQINSLIGIIIVDAFSLLLRRAADIIIFIDHCFIQAKVNNNNNNIIIILLLLDYLSVNTLEVSLRRYVPS